MEEFAKSRVSVSMCSPSRQRITPEFSSGVQVAEYIPIAPTLKKLKVGEVAQFPAEQRTSVMATIYRLRKEYARQGWDVEILGEDESKDKYSFSLKRIG